MEHYSVILSDTEEDTVDVLASGCGPAKDVFNGDRGATLLKLIVSLHHTPEGSSNISDSPGEKFV